MREHSELPWVAIEGDTLNPERPWGVSRYLSREACEEIDGEDATWPSRTEVIAEVCDGEPGIAEADAKFIVRACNAYEDLLAACKVAADILRAEAENNTGLVRVAIDKAVRNCCDAISKAECE